MEETEQQVIKHRLPHHRQGECPEDLGSTFETRATEFPIHGRQSLLSHLLVASSSLFFSGSVPLPPVAVNIRTKTNSSVIEL